MTRRYGKRRWPWSRVETAGVTRFAIVWDLRWAIAERYNRRPDTCWATLVDWIMDDVKDDPEGASLLPRDLGQGICMVDRLSCGSCYCGKLREPDVLSDGSAA